MQKLSFIFVLLVIFGIAPAISRADGVFRIIVMGDSLTAGWGMDIGTAFPAQLQTALQKQGYPVEILNAGVSGDTTSGGRQRVAWLLSDDPDLVIVALGANDALRGIDPAVVRDNLDAIITELKTGGVDVLLAGMQAPPNYGPQYQAGFDALYTALAEKHEIALYPFFLEGVAAEPDLNMSDGKHPNPHGVAVMVENILPVLLPLLPQAAEITDEH